MTGKNGNEIEVLENLAASGNSSAISILSRRPQLYPWLVPIAQAFQRLSRSRNMNGYIPLSEIIAHHRAFHSEYDLSDFAQLIYAANDAAMENSRQNAGKTK